MNKVAQPIKYGTSKYQEDQLRESLGNFYYLLIKEVLLTNKYVQPLLDICK